MTKRQVDVLELVAMGLTNAEIAERLFLSEETVKTHMTHLRLHLGARNRAHAVWLGVVGGWLETASPDATKNHSQGNR